jgi:hypothetical protein
MAKPQVVVAPVLMSKLSANAPEFYPSGYSSHYTVSALFSYNSGLVLQVIHQTMLLFSVLP